MQFPSVPVCPANGTIGNHLAAASPQVGWPAAAPVTVYAGFVVVMVLIAIVVYPAVWSEQPDRRKAAQIVLRTLVRLVRIWRR